MRDFWAEFAALWESFRLEIHEFIDAGDQVVTPFTNHLRGREGIELEGRGAWVWTIRDALIVQVCLYQERREALEAAGLSEVDGPGWIRTTDLRIMSRRDTG